MSRLSGIPSKTVMRLAEDRGWRLDRVRGDHFVYRHASLKGILSIPAHRELSPGVLHSLIKEMGMSINEFLEVIGRR